MDHATTPTTTKHRQHVARAQVLVDAFLSLLQQLDHRKGVYMFSMDLYTAFEGFADVELPGGFHQEFGRRITQACEDGRLSFVRKPKTKARLAAFEGIDSEALETLLRAATANRPLGSQQTELAIAG